MITVMKGTNRAAVSWMLDLCPGDHADEPLDMNCVWMTRDDQIIASFGFYEKVHGRNAVLAASVARPGSAWASRASLRALFTYPFIDLGYDEIVTIVRSTDLRARRFNRRLGFVRTPPRLCAAPDKSGLLSMHMMRHQCRWIDGILQAKES